MSKLPDSLDCGWRMHRRSGLNHPSTCTGSCGHCCSEQQRAEWGLWTLKFTTCRLFFFLCDQALIRDRNMHPTCEPKHPQPPSPTLISAVLSHPSRCRPSHSAPRIAGASHARAALVTRQDPAEQAALSSRHEKASTPGTHPGRAIAIRSPIPGPAAHADPDPSLPEPIRQSRTRSNRGRMPDAPLPRGQSSCRESEWRQVTMLPESRLRRPSAVRGGRQKDMEEAARRVGRRPPVLTRRGKSPRSMPTERAMGGGGA